MRVFLAGEGDPIPQVALPDPNLSSDLPPQTFLFSDGDGFLKADWVGLGYTHYEVICIGAVGGNGGGQRMYSGDMQFSISFGGGGGGGGLHRMAGLLSELPDSCPVVVGQAGDNGIDGDTSPSHFVVPTSGGDGGVSSFNTETCFASGGKGADPTRIAAGNYPDSWPIFGPGGNGGEGGVGGRALAGGGAFGAESELHYEGGVEPTDYRSATLFPAEDGTWDGGVGQGGGGGRGGNYLTPGDFRAYPSRLEEASSGGQGSFSYGDTSVYGPRQSRQLFTGFGVSQILIPGSGGGAKLSKLATYGSRSPGANPNGAVFIRLTKVT